MTKKRTAVLLRLWQYLYKHKWLLLLAATLTLCSNTLMLLGPMLSGKAIDAIAPGKGLVQFDKVFFYCTLMIIFYVIASGFGYALSRLMIHISQKVVHQMRKDAFERLSALPVGYFDRHQTGDLISRFTYDIDTINASLSNDCIQIATSLITVIGSLIMMLQIAPILVVIFIVTIPVSIFYTRYMAKRVRPRFKKRSAKLGELNGFVEETLSAQQSIKAYHQEINMLNRFKDKNTEAVDAYYQAEYYSSTVGPSINFINNLSLSLVSMFGALLYLFNYITIGNLSSFVLYSRKFSGPINEIANISSELQSALAAAERFFRLIDEDMEPSDAPQAHLPETIEGAIEFKHVAFGYTPEKMVIRDLTLSVAPGKTVAIVGHTGAGKTTLVNLLMRFYDPTAGTITLDGIDIMTMPRTGLRRAYAMVLQNTWLFNGTIYENIVYGNEQATLEDAIKVAKAAKAHHFIMQMQQGYDTIIEEDGSNLSHGQKQLLTIARAMLMDANLLILDEATSSVDTRTEVMIQQAMISLMKNKTCFVIAHRLSTIVGADTILVMKDGDVIENGNHETLMANRGHYFELFNAQFQ